MPQINTQKVKELLGLSGMTQKELAEQLRISPSLLSE
jgi:transcriptional regulator with XRE-family HTH domain